MNNNNDKAVSPKNIDSYLERDALAEKLKADFAKTQKNTFTKITTAINNNDRETAHRLAHSLKSLAGLINEDTLAQVAKSVETSLSLRGATNEELTALETELNRVLHGIKPKEASRNNTPKILVKEKAKDVFNRLKPLLTSRNAEGLQMIDELKEIPDTDTLIEQIEDFDFGLALQTLEALQETFGI